MMGTGVGLGAAQATRRRGRIGRRTNRHMGLPPFHTKKVGLTMVVDIVVQVMKGGKRGRTLGVRRQGEVGAAG